MFKHFCGMFIICRLSGRKETEAYCFKNEHKLLEKGIIKLNYPDYFPWPSTKGELQTIAACNTSIARKGLNMLIGVFPTVNKKGERSKNSLNKITSNNKLPSY